jgi:DNA-binding PadR family transcriptional regulator
LATARLTTADLVVLTMLHERAMHGYELVKTLEERDYQDWAPVSRPQVYYSLRKLDAAGLIRQTKSHTEALGPDRIVYKPTAKATAAMQAALAHERWVERRPPTPFNTWAALALHAAPEEIQRQLKRRGAFLEREIRRETQTLRDLMNLGSKEAAVARFLVALALRQFKAELDSLDELRAALLP